jgi:hypothetical protein
MIDRLMRSPMPLPFELVLKNDLKICPASCVGRRLEDAGAVGYLCADTQAVQVVHVTAEDLCPGTGERFGARVRTAKSDDVMACVDEFRNEKRTDKAGGARRIHFHPAPPHQWSGPPMQPGTMPAIKSAIFDQIA